MRTLQRVDYSLDENLSAESMPHRMQRDCRESIAHCFIAHTFCMRLTGPLGGYTTKSSKKTRRGRPKTML